MTGGGWTQVMNQPAAPGPYLPDDQSSVGGFGDNSDAYRLGGAEISSITPATGWRLTDFDQIVYFRPQCVVSWANDFTGADEAVNPATGQRDCTTGYNDIAFTTLTQSWTTVATRGIGINAGGNNCSMRGWISTGWASFGGTGSANDCDFFDATVESVGLWFKRSRPAEASAFCVKTTPSQRRPPGRRPPRADALPKKCF